MRTRWIEKKKRDAVRPEIGEGRYIVNMYNEKKSEPCRSPSTNRFIADIFSESCRKENPENPSLATFTISGRVHWGVGFRQRRTGPDGE